MATGAERTDPAAVKARLDEEVLSLYRAHPRGGYSYNYYRDRSRRPQTGIDDAETLAATHTTEALVQDRDDLKRILECVQRLLDDRREALIMRFALGMDNREIARALGRTDGATKVLLHRAIRQLEELVKSEAGSAGGWATRGAPWTGRVGAPLPPPQAPRGGARRARPRGADAARRRPRGAARVPRRRALVIRIAC